MIGVAVMVAAPARGEGAAMSEAALTADMPDQPPQIIKTAPPEYPFGLRADRLEGEVYVEFSIDPKGRVRDAFVQKSTNPWFERAALKAVERWQFKPGMKDGKPVTTRRVLQQISFRINDGGSAWRIKKSKDHDKLPVALQWDTAPEPTNTTFPVYPFDLLRAGTKGKTRLACVVGPEGDVLKAELQEATTPEMGLASLAMIDAWKFKPARKRDGTPCFALVAMEHVYTPLGRDSVPVSDEALRLLRALEKHPESFAELQDLDHKPKPLSQRPPVFPPALQGTTTSGQAIIEFFIDKDGDAHLPRIISCTVPEFGYAAAQAIVAWRFEPPMKGGKSTYVRAQVPVKFSLLVRLPSAPKAP